jgi:hypothetical protein
MLKRKGKYLSLRDEYVSRVNRLLMANLTASRQSRIGKFFGSVQSIAGEED